MALMPAYDGLVALAGGAQAGATQLREGVNRVVTVATAADSAVLPITQGEAGLMVVVENAAAANSMNVFPAPGEKINALAANAAFAVAANKCCLFICTGYGQWHSILTA